MAKLLFTINAYLTLPTSRQPIGSPLFSAISSWIDAQKQNARTFFDTIYLFYTAPVDLEPAPVN